jgi:hypothetical protein
MNPVQIAGALPPHPRPSLKDRGHQPGGIVPAGQHSLPQNPQDHKGSLRPALRADPCGPGEPAAAPQGARPRR